MNARRQYSMRLILAVSLVGLQLIAVSAIIFFTFISSERALLRQSNLLLHKAGENVISEVESFLAPARQSLEVTQRFAESGVLDPSDEVLLERHLFEQLQSAPQIAGFYFANPSGHFVYVMRSDETDRYRTKFIDPFEQGSAKHPARYVWRNDQFQVLETAFDPNDSYEARTRPWFLQAEAQLAPIWTDPYIYFTTQQPGITYAAPVLSKDGTLVGILGIDIAINAISGFLADLRADAGTTAIIMNQAGEVLAHPDLELITNGADSGRPSLVTVDQINDAVAQTAFGKFSSAEQTSEIIPTKELELNNSRYVSRLVPVAEQNLNWTVGIYAPVDTFIGEIKSARTRWIWVAAIVAGLTGLIGLRLADWINRPLREFESGTKLATQGDVRPDDVLHSPYKELEHTGQVIAQEIRARQRFEAAYGRTFEMTSRGMAQLDPETGKFLRTNTQLGDLLGVETEQLLQMHLFDFLPADTASPLLNFSATLRENSEFIQDVHLTLQDGSKTWLRLNAILILDESGNPDHAVAIFDDVNAQKQGNELTLQLNQELSHLSRVNLMGEMASGIAHELNQPLAAIAYNVDALQLSMGELGISDSEIEQICNDIERQAHRAGDIIHALRDLVRKDRGRMVPFDITDLCAQTIKLIEFEARSRSIRIVLEQKDTPEVIGNRTQIAQVVVNLLRNAIDAMANDHQQHQQITVRIETEGDEVIVSVADQGPGVSTETALFQKFDTFKPGGMGLGLSICRSIVEGHGGRIWHENRPEGGAQFNFSLKLNTTQSKEVA